MTFEASGNDWFAKLFSTFFEVLPAAPVDAPWTSTDIGNVGQMGGAVFSTDTSTFVVAGSGADIWGIPTPFNSSRSRSPATATCAHASARRTTLIRLPKQA